MTIGEKFKHFIKECFGSIKSGADVFQVRPSTFYDYFNGKTTPGGNMIRKCYKHGINLNWLFGDENNMMRTKKINNNINLFDLFGDIRAGISKSIDIASLEFDDLHIISTKELFNRSDKYLEKFNLVILSIHSISTFSIFKKYSLIKEFYSLTDLTPYQYRSKVLEVIDTLKSDLICNNSIKKDR